MVNEDPIKAANHDKNDYSSETEQIIGAGANGSIEDFNFMASYCHFQDFLCRHLCTAIIVTPYKLLTAAHCLVHFNDSFKIVVGASYIYDFDEDQNPYRKQVDIKSVTIHPQYDRKTGLYDVGIINLQTGLTFIPGIIWNIPIATKPLDSGINVTLVGMGKYNSHPNNQGGLLRNFQAQILGPDDCHQEINKIPGKFPGKHGLLCATALNEDSSTCEGDSGGAVLLPGIQPQLGALIHGRRNSKYCKVFPYPTIGTDLTHPVTKAFLIENGAKEADPAPPRPSSAPNESGKLCIVFVLTLMIVFE